MRQLSAGDNTDKLESNCVVVCNQAGATVVEAGRGRKAEIWGNLIQARLRFTTSSPEVETTPETTIIS
jgi:hypothetical protein